MAKDHANSPLSAVRQPIERANCLSNPHYIDEDTFAHASLAGLAVAADVPQIGDAKPLEFLGIPLLLLHGKDGTVRVFLKICRHRGMILVNKARKIEGAIRCAYHSWCYSTKGDLVSTPHVGGAGHNTHMGHRADRPWPDRRAQPYLARRGVHQHRRRRRPV